MTAAEAVLRHLLTVSAVTALVGSRVYNQLLPQSPTLPAVVVQDISQLEGAHLRGADGVFRTRVQIDVYAKTKASADAVDEAIHGDGAGSGLAFFTGTAGDLQIDVIRPEAKRDGFEPGELRQFRVMRDYFVHHRFYA